MKKFKALPFIMFFLIPSWCFAASPLPFSGDYEVRFVTGLKAAANLTLTLADNGEYTFSSLAELKVFGKRITKVSANGSFTWNEENVVPQAYEYIQTGVGRKTRSITYDWQSQTADIIVKGEAGTLPLVETMLDELSMYIEIQQQAAAGIEDIYLKVIDEDVIKEYHYQLLGEEQLETELGLFDTVKYRRVREPGSTRETVLWLAKDWGHLVLELHQKTRIRTFKIILQQATLDNRVMLPLD